jgi:hypothetical protein
VGLSCSFVETEAKFNASSLLLNSRNFDILRQKEYSQNSETRALIKTPVARLLVERHKKRHLAAQVHSANGLRDIIKFSEILGRPTYISATHGHSLHQVIKDTKHLGKDLSINSNLIQVNTNEGLIEFMCHASFKSCGNTKSMAHYLSR